MGLYRLVSSSTRWSLKSSGVPQLLESVVYLLISGRAYDWHMAKTRWVLKCKDCRTECTFAEISTEGTANYFFPKKPGLPENGFTYTCPNCGHKNVYKRTDLIHQDDAIAPSPEAANCK